MLNKEHFDFHDCTLEKIKHSDAKMTIYLLPAREIFSDINHICFSNVRILKNDLLPNDFGNCVWLSHTVDSYESSFVMTVIFQNVNSQSKKLSFSFGDAVITTDDISEEEFIFETWPKNKQMYRFLTAKSDLRIAKRWVNSEFYSNPIVSNLLLNAAENAIHSICSTERITICEQNSPKRLNSILEGQLKSSEKYTDLFKFLDYCGDKEKIFNRNEYITYISVFSELLYEIKTVLEKRII